MNILVVLFPLALGLGLFGLAAFFWCMRTGQYADLEGAGWRVLQDDDLGLDAAAFDEILDGQARPEAAEQPPAASLTRAPI